MLPVQTVMIRYMVLVYRWGSGWLGAVGDCGGSLGGSVRGGCVHAVACRRRGCRYQNRARKGPANEGSAGPLINLRIINSIKIYFLFSGACSGFTIVFM